jgi:uncharacterized protein YciI
MTYFAVIREAGPGWTPGRSTLGQPGVNEHTAFMNRLAQRGVVLFAGPLGGTEHGRLRALLIINAQREAEIHAHLADDPWATTQRLQITSIESWHPLVGEEQLRPTQAAPHA